MAKQSRAQIPSHQWKRQSSALLDAPRRCSRVQIPSWAGKRPRVLLDSRRLQSWTAITQKTLSWGAKRARTTYSNRVDWPNLGDGPAGLIAEFVLAKDVADYVRFRAVCHAWRRCSPDPRSQRCFGDSRYHPRQWIMLDKAAAAHPRCRRFLNLTTGECIRMDLPELEEHALLALTPEGLILLLDEPTRVVRLLNPLTGQLNDLPPVTALLTPEWQLDWHLGDTIQVHGASVVDASTVVVSFRLPKALVVAKPGDEGWTLVDNRSFESVLPYAGRLYCATRRGVEVLRLNANTDGEGEAPRLLPAIDWGSTLRMRAMMNDSLHLVDNAGDLMLVHRMMRWVNHEGEGEGDYKRKWAVYKVDTDNGVLIPAKSFRGRAVFMGFYRTVSVSVDAFDVAADTLYFGYECGDEAMYYNLGSGEIVCYRDVNVDGCDCDGTDEPCNYCMDWDREGPWNIATCLCNCIQGIGKELV